MRGGDDIPLMVPLTDATVRPLTKVTYEPAGMVLTAVKVTSWPATGGLQPSVGCQPLGPGQCHP